jgi:hypothetical protein
VAECDNWLGSSASYDDGRHIRQSMDPLQRHREFYANYVVRSGGSTDPRLIAAFAKVRQRDHADGHTTR